MGNNKIYIIMAIENFIYFNGNCKEAVEYYAEVFGLDKPQFMICKDVPGIPDFCRLLSGIPIN